MTATGHALLGTIFAAKIGDPILLASVSFVSHFICDAVPHWDSGTHINKKTKTRLFWEAVADVLVGFTLSFILYFVILKQTSFQHVMIGIIFAQLPDWFSAPYFILGIKLPLFKWVEGIQVKINHRLDKPWGIVTQAGVIVLTYITLFKIF